ncbi:metallopeptidase [Thalassoglobus sp.]|uniref:metallopeptidase n=1 Tax=Thalassoglobus sp. TaxID=2795869 RepID=UPI003AA87D19
MLSRPLLFILMLLVLIVATCGTSGVAQDAAGEKILKHQIQTISGWTVHVDEELISGQADSLGEVALRLLDNKLYEIKLRLPAERVKQLQTIHIWIDAHHELTSMQYHPGAGWLKEHGYDPKMVKSVHIPRAQGFVDHIAQHAQPWALLHELAHAYHDQFLGWEHTGIRQAYEEMKESGKFEQVLHISGRQRPHYALTNPKEFFAEMSEAFLGTNDFYPFVRGELRESLPETYALMQSIWLKSK